MPDPWEYPWYAAWDLAFHCVALAHVDPTFAKDQLILLCREWYMHPNGQLPAYEWAFGDVNPPVHAWAALRVFEIDGGTRLRLPRAASSTSCCSTSPGGSTARTPTATTCSRAASSASTTSARSTARRRCPSAAAGAVRRHGVDGACTASTCWRWRCALAEHDPTLRGHRDQVLRALRLHRRRRCDDRRPVGRARTASTTTCSAPPTARAIAAAGALDGRAAPAVATARRSARRTLDTLPDFADRLRVVRRNKPQFASVAHVARARRHRAAAAVDAWRPDAARRMLPRAARRGRVPVAARPARRCRRGTRDHPFSARPRPARPRASTTSRRSRRTGLFGGNSNWRGPSGSR